LLHEQADRRASTARVWTNVAARGKDDVVDSPIAADAEVDMPDSNFE
jgi:hypothetical protein